MGEPISSKLRVTRAGSLLLDLARKFAGRSKPAARHFLPKCGLAALAALLAAQWVVASQAPHRVLRPQDASPQAQRLLQERPTPASSNPANSPPVEQAAQSAQALPGPLGRFRAELLQLALVIVVSSGLAAMRVREKFRHYSWPGLLRNSYSLLFVGFVASLSACSYLGLAELENLLKAALPSLHPGLMDALKIAGGAAGGHALLALGRLAPRFRSNPVAPGQSPGWQELEAPDTLLAFFYNGIYDRITERMHRDACMLAGRFNWKTVRECTCTLLMDEMTARRLPPEKGRKVLEKIRSLPPAGQDEDLNKYLALSWTLGKCSYSQLESRLKQEEVS